MIFTLHQTRIWYFTDQGQTGIIDPTGRVFRLTASGELHKLVTNAPSPNGITVNNSENQVYVAITRSQQIWRLPLMADNSVSKSGVAIQLSGGHAGPDGLEMDSEDGMIVNYLGLVFGDLIVIVCQHTLFIQIITV